MNATLKQPGAWVPLAMSTVALTIVLCHLAVFGIAREADEGTAAHLFQFLIAGQTPVVAFFVIKWLPKNLRRALAVMALQVGAALAAFVPVFLFHL